MKSLLKKSVRSSKRNEGFALVMVLIIVTVLVTLAIEMNFSSRIGAKVTANLRDSAKAFYLAKSGFNMAMQRIRMDNLAHQMFSQYIGDSDNLGEFWWTVPLLYPLGSDLFGELLDEAGIKKNKLDAYAESQDIGGTFTSIITDESARININDVQLAEKTPNGAYLALLNLISLPKFNEFFRYKPREEFVNRVVDWIDSNSQVAGLGGGIEDADYYDYHVKNASFFSPLELKLIKDVTDNFFDEIEPFVTVFPYSVPQAHVPLGRINVNTAPKEVIAALFDRSVVRDPELIAKAIQKFRDEGQAFNKKEEFIEFLKDQFSMDFEAKVKPIPRAIENTLDTRSDYFRIESSGTANDSTKTITAVIDRKKNTYSILYWRVD